jgi:hypothetical protein
MSDSRIDRLVKRLWPHGDTLDGSQVHAIVDAAQHPSIVGMVRTTGLERCCLFSGALAPALEAAAPFLVHLSPTAPFTQRLFEQGWGAHWCVALTAPADVSMQQLRRHLRTLLRVQDEQGRHLMFRFYDPRVLRAYLPTCTADEAAQVFGPIERWVCEDAAAGAGVAHAGAATWLEFDRPLPGHTVAHRTAVHAGAAVADSAPPHELEQEAACVS